MPGLHIETLVNPARYSREQLDEAALIAGALDRGRLVVVIAPDETAER